MYQFLFGFFQLFFFSETTLLQLGVSWTDTIAPPTSSTRNVSTPSHFKKLVRQMELSNLISNECGSDCFLYSL